MRYLWIATFALLLLTITAPAHATLMIAVDVDGVQACAVDNDAFACSFGTQISDVDATVGVTSFGNLPTTINGVEITGSAQQQSFAPPDNILNTASTQIENLTGLTKTIQVAISGTDFVPTATQAFLSGSATWENAQGSSILMEWWNDPTNQQGAETATDTPGLLVDSFSDLITLAADATGFAAGPYAVFDPNPFSMTLFTEFVLAPGAKVVNRGQTIIKNSVPEPALLGLVGIGLLGLARRHRRRI